MTVTTLSNRAIVRLNPLAANASQGSEEYAPPEDVRGFLQGLVTNDVSAALPAYAALLSAQGKMMFDFFVWDGGDGAVLLECEAGVADDLVRRLSLYRLRRKIEIARDDTLAALWSVDAFEGASPDPRLAQLGHRAIGKASPGAPHEVWLVLDSTNGQNAISQAKVFTEVVDVSGIVLTKLDGTAKGGVVIGITDEMAIPVRYIGIGEKVEDLRPFDAEGFADALFAED